MLSTIYLYKAPSLAKEMAPSSEVSMGSRAALTVLSHDNHPAYLLPEDYGCRNLQVSRQRDPGERRSLWMTVDSGCAPLLLWISMLVMKSDHRTLQICRRHFQPKVSIFLSLLFATAHVSEPQRSTGTKYGSYSQSFCLKGYTGLPDISLQAAEHATTKLHSSLNLQTFAAGLAG